MLKRFFDLFFSVLGLLVLLPFFVLIALWIKLDSKGPVFYRQVRVGKNNRDFRLFKFRSMHIDADKKGLLTVGGRDPRVTRSGHFLRRFKLDELPQLINVVIGDMSLVGPRPEVRKYVDLYTPEQMRVLSVKPGITDNASIEFIDENTLLGQADDPEAYYIKELIPRKTAIYLKYIDNQSFLNDLRLIVRTLFKIVS